MQLFVSSSMFMVLVTFCDAHLYTEQTYRTKLLTESPLCRLEHLLLALFYPCHCECDVPTTLLKRLSPRYEIYWTTVISQFVIACDVGGDEAWACRLFIGSRNHGTGRSKGSNASEATWWVVLVRKAGDTVAFDTIHYISGYSLYIMFSTVPSFALTTKR